MKSENINLLFHQKETASTAYRHYETWISKGIPIIQRNPFTERKYSGLPILWTDDYSEINDKYLEAKYNEFLDKEFDFRRILLSKYTPEIQRQINTCYKI